MNETPAQRSPRSFINSLPNLLTWGRVVIVPIIVLLMLWPEDHVLRWTAFALYAIAGISDFFDGWLARRLNQHSSFGQMLDPIADKLLVATVILMVVADKTLAGWSIWAGFIILSREILVSGLREYLAGLKVSVPVSHIAKWKTTLQILALGFLVAGPAGETVLPGTITIGIVLLWLAALLTLYTGRDYLRVGIRHVDDAPL